MNRGTIVRNDIIYSGEKDKVSYVPTLSEGTEIGTLTINGEDNVLYAPAGGGGGGSYTLPAATSTTLGGIKVGENLTIDDDGVLSAESGGGASAWEDLTDKPFEILSETDFEVDENNVLSIKDKGTDVSYTATIEEGTELGTLSIDGEDEIIYAPITAKELTFAEYMALTEEEKNADVAYYISDAPGTVSTVSQAVAFSTQGGTENTLRFGKNENGEYGYYPPGADTLVPFKTGDGGGSSALICRNDGMSSSLVPGITVFYLKVKGLLNPSLSFENDFEVSSNVTNITYVNDTVLKINTSALTDGEKISITILDSAFKYELGEKIIFEMTVENKFKNYLFENTLGNIIVNTYNDAGNWNFTVPNYFPIKTPVTGDNFTFSEGFIAQTKTWNLNADSILTPARGVPLYIKNRDNSIRKGSWLCFTTNDIEGNILKIRFEGNDPYSSTTANNFIYEIYIFSNQDIMLAFEQVGTSSDGTNNIFGKAYTMPTTNRSILSFYSKNINQSDFNIVDELYTPDHSYNYDRIKTAQNAILSDVIGNHQNMFLVLNDNYHDDNAIDIQMPKLNWKYSTITPTYLTVSGNTWIGIGSTNEDVKVNRADADLYTVYVADYIFEDIGKCWKINWIGAATHSKNIDQEWELYLFENGDAMMHCTKYGAQRGSSAFFNQTITMAAGKTYSFYRTNAEGTTWETREGIYDISYHHSFE